LTVKHLRMLHRPIGPASSEALTSFREILTSVNFAGSPVRSVWGSTPRRSN